MTITSSSVVQDAEAALLVRHQSRAWCWCMCLGLALMLSGVVVGGAYLYRYYILEVSDVAQVIEVKTPPQRDQNLTMLAVTIATSERERKREK